MNTKRTPSNGESMRRALARLAVTGAFLCLLAPHATQAQGVPDSARAYSIVVEGLPESTPHDATLYATGNFNDWAPGDSAWRLREDGKGKRVITFPFAPDTIEFKITRGAWSSVEGRSNGLARTNRSFVRREGEPATAYVEVLSWEDIDGGRMNAYTFWLLFAALQGLLLVAAINGLQENNRRSNLTLSALILLISVGLLGRAVMYFREVFQWQPKLLLLPDFIYFLYGPCFYFYVKALLTVQTRPFLRRWYHFAPFFVQLAVYFPLLVAERDPFVDAVVDDLYRPLFAGAGGLALIYNAFYWHLSRKAILRYRAVLAQTASDENLAFLGTIMTLQGVCLVIWLCTALAYAGGKLFGYEVGWVTEYSVDTIWLVFAGITCFLGYFAINRPELLRIPEQAADRKPGPPVNLDLLSYRLAEVMEKQKPYLNPKLTLSELAETLDVQPQTLSRVINEGKRQNFYDFVNGYRVEEFKRLIEREESKRYTFLALAYQVGFNSKTAFNRSFKKFTGQTPSAYARERARQASKRAR